MDAFEKLQNSWTTQKEVKPNEGALHKIKIGAKNVSKQYVGNQIILGITAGAVLTFALVYAGFSTTTTAIGFSLMIGCLLVRIGFEFYHNHRMKMLDFTLGANDLRNKLVKHFDQRKWVHYVLTPLCVITYTVGFILLLPTFKNALSEGFYTYILISGPILLVLLIGLLVYVIRKENKLNNQLKQLFTTV